MAAGTAQKVVHLVYALLMTVQCFCLKFTAGTTFGRWTMSEKQNADTQFSGLGVGAKIVPLSSFGQIDGSSSSSAGGWANNKTDRRNRSSKRPLAMRFR